MSRCVQTGTVYIETHNVIFDREYQPGPHEVQETDKNSQENTISRLQKLHRITESAIIVKCKNICGVFLGNS